MSKTGKITTKMNKIVELDAVSKVFENGVTALDGFDLSLKAGERLSLLGPSGCGKSTALKIIAGLENATTGKVWRCDSVEKSVSFVFQEPTLMPWADVLDNIALPLKLAGSSKPVRRRTAMDFCAKMGLQGFEEAFPNQLSGGMQMRVSIARALINKPRLLLMDEPFAALDEITRFGLNDLLLNAQEVDGFSLVFVTHSVSESVYLSDRVALMTSRPGRHFDVVETATDGARNGDYRLSTPYLALCKKVSTGLNQAIAAN